jgi:hypothetical protein
MYGGRGIEYTHGTGRLPLSFGDDAPHSHVGQLCPQDETGSCLVIESLDRVATCHDGGDFSGSRRRLAPSS